MTTKVPPSIALIQRSIDRIEENLDNDINLEQLAREADMSFWHFLRVFRATVGETVKDYIRRRRLTRAAYALLETQRNVLDIALESCFESHEAFTRAFRAQFGCTPRDFRQAGLAPSFPRARTEISADYLAHLYQGISREPEIVKRPHLRLVGLKAELTVPPEAFDLLALGAPIWSAFEQQIDLVRNKVDDQALLICDILASSEQHIRCILMPCVAVRDFVDVPDNCLAEVRPASRDAVFRHRGAGRAWEYTLQYLFGAWLHESAESLSDLPLVYRFDPQHSPFSASPELELWLALSQNEAALA